MCKQRTTLTSGGAVISRAADEFVPAIGFFDEAGGAKGGDEMPACVVEKTELGTLPIRLSHLQGGQVDDYAT